MRMNYEVGLQSCELLDIVHNPINVTFNGNVRRIQPNIAILQQGASLISKKELEIGILICKWPNANAYEEYGLCCHNLQKSIIFKSLEKYHILMFLTC